MRNEFHELGLLKRNIIYSIYINNTKVSNALEKYRIVSEPIRHILMGYVRVS